MVTIGNILNDNVERKNVLTKNYFYAATFAIIIVNYAIFAFVLKTGKPAIGEDHWYDVFYFETIIQAFCNSFLHNNFQHVALNMLCFFVCGIYLERKMGSLPFVLLILAMAFFTAAAVAGNYLSVWWRGFSGTNFGLYAYIIIDYLFLLQKSKRTKTNLIIGAIIVGLVYLAMCFDGGTASFGFRWYPYDLMHNLGHYTSFVAGLIFALSVQIVKLITEKQMQNTAKKT